MFSHKKYDYLIARNLIDSLITVIFASESSLRVANLIRRKEFLIL